MGFTLGRFWCDFTWMPGNWHVEIDARGGSLRVDVGPIGLWAGVSEGRS